jgi:hypothetical protein
MKERWVTKERRKKRRGPRPLQMATPVSAPPLSELLQRLAEISVASYQLITAIECEDIVAETTLAEKVLQAVTAKEKALDWIDHNGHFGKYEELREATNRLECIINKVFRQPFRHEVERDLTDVDDSFRAGVTPKRPNTDGQSTREVSVDANAEGVVGPHTERVERVAGVTAAASSVQERETNRSSETDVSAHLAQLKLYESLGARPKCRAPPKTEQVESDLPPPPEDLLPATADAATETDERPPPFPTQAEALIEFAEKGVVPLAVVRPNPIRHARLSGRK